MFSNLLSHVKRMRIKSSFLPPFFSLSLCFHFYFSEYPRGNFITYIAKYFHELRAPGMPVWREIENPIRGINNDNSVAGEDRRRENSETSILTLLTPLPFFPSANYRNFGV